MLILRIEYEIKDISYINIHFFYMSYTKKKKRKHEHIKTHSIRFQHIVAEYTIPVQ